MKVLLIIFLGYKRLLSIEDKANLEEFFILFV